MGGCRCSYRTCKSATKISGELHFFHYPVKHKERCHQWIRNARKFEFLDLPDDQLRNKVICDMHFEQRFFTNVQRKRLVHDAIPTLNGGCEDEPSTEIFKDVQILPANDDGTIFTVDTDSMQQRADNEPICTYSFRNGALIPVYTEEEEDTEQIVYTIDENHLKSLTSYREGHESSNNYVYINPSNQNEDSENYEIIFNGNSSNSQEKSRSSSPVQPAATDVTTNKIDVIPAEDPMEVVYVTERHEEEPEVVIKTEPGVVVKKRTSKRKEAKLKEVSKNEMNTILHNKKFMRQIKIHSREIASIKRTLKASFKKPQKLGVINALRGRISPTLLGALTLNLSKKKGNFTRDEYNFITTLYGSSPETYKILIEKLDWDLPDPVIVQELIKRSYK